MKVLVTLDSFKGSISSVEGSKAVALGINDVFPHAEVITLPLADGGEGTVAALLEAIGGTLVETKVSGPLSLKKNAEYGILKDGNTAVIEVAEACGLALVPFDQRNPLLTTTYGVGQLIVDAIERGCKEFIIGLGGTATNDGGIGMLQALGFRFLDEKGMEVGLGGRVLKNVRFVDTNHVIHGLADCNFRVACDVTNVLHGPTGAAHVFGPQKGATQEIAEFLDEGLKHFAEVVSDQLGIDLQKLPGAGAAGGLGAAFSGFLPSKLESGIELILNISKTEEKMQGADFVVTGEGKLDEQTAMGKAPLGIAQLAGKYKIPVIALAGAVPSDASVLNELGITSCFSISNAPMSLEEAMHSKVAFNNLRGISRQLFELIHGVVKKAEQLQK